MNENIVLDRLRYAQQFAETLRNGYAQSLLQLSLDKSIHAMKALSNLAKYTAQYDQWLQLRQRYNLEWSTDTEKLDFFQRFFDDNKTLDTMLQLLRQAMQQLPKAYSDMLLFSILTGLWASECANCIRLINDAESLKIYYNESHQCLEHFKFPNICIRGTKSAYISLVSKETNRLAQNRGKSPTFKCLKLVCKRSNCLKSMQLKYGRKIFASYLRQIGKIESENVDLLQGRVPKSVFARLYFTPSLDYRNKVLDTLKQFQEQL
jgi:hypothetical protein